MTQVTVSDHEPKFEIPNVKDGREREVKREKNNS
jgi:hypothetical protein